MSDQRDRKRLSSTVELKLLNSSALSLGKQKYNKSLFQRFCLSKRIYSSNKSSLSQFLQINTVTTPTCLKCNPLDKIFQLNKSKVLKETCDRLKNENLYKRRRGNAQKIKSDYSSCRLHDSINLNCMYSIADGKILEKLSYV